MTLRDLLEKRARVVAEMREITNSATGDLSAEAERRFDQLKAELATLEAAIGRQQLLDEAERRMAGDPIAGTGDHRLDDALRDYSIVRAIASQVPDLRSRIDCGRELELSAELQRRSGQEIGGIAIPFDIFRQPVRESRQIISTGSGSGLIFTDHRGDQFIDILRAKLVTRRLGARILDGLTGNVSIPKKTAGSSVGWVAEDSSLSSTHGTYSSATMQPRHVGAINEYSRNMLLQSSPAIEELVRNDIAERIAYAIDYAALNSTSSTGNSPTGLAGSTGLQTVVATTAPTWAKILEVQGKIELANAADGALGWAVNPWFVTRGRAQPKSTAGSGDGFAVDRFDVIGDYPAVQSTILPGQASTTGTAVDAVNYFGNWNEMLIGQWSALDTLVNPYSSGPFSKGNVEVRVMASVDVLARHGESFCQYSIDFTT